MDARSDEVTELVRDEDREERAGELRGVDHRGAREVRSLDRA